MNSSANGNLPPAHSMLVPELTRGRLLLAVDDLVVQGLSPATFKPVVKVGLGQTHKDSLLG